jgi:hypothetical protein
MSSFEPSLNTAVGNISMVYIPTIGQPHIRKLEWCMGYPFCLHNPDTTLQFEDDILLFVKLKGVIRDAKRLWKHPLCSGYEDTDKQVAENHRNWEEVIVVSFGKTLPHYIANQNMANQVFGPIFVSRIFRCQEALVYTPANLKASEIETAIELAHRCIPEITQRMQYVPQLSLHWKNSVDEFANDLYKFDGNGCPEYEPIHNDTSFEFVDNFDEIIDSFLNEDCITDDSGAISIREDAWNDNYGWFDDFSLCQIG